MQNASPISVLTCALLCASTALADEEASVLATRAILPAGVLSVSTLSSDFDWSPTPFEAVEFLDNSALAKLKRIEELRLLTISETRGTRLFLGVNSDGLVGLHFRIK